MLTRLSRLVTLTAQKRNERSVNREKEIKK